MPVPVWDSSDLDFFDDQPLDSTTVVSEDIWKKFNLDALDDHHHNNDHCKNMSVFDDCFNSTNEHLSYEQKYCLKSREIRHHDCMWAGLCISKEHNRTLPAKKPPQIHKNVAAGRSLLISRANTQISNETNQEITKPLNVQKNTNHNNNSKLYSNQNQQRQGRQVKALESDGDSARSETPPSSSFGSESEEDEDDDDDVVRQNFNDINKDQIPMFRHDQISINERLSECMSDTAASKAVPIGEVTGQFVRRLYFHQHQQHHTRRKSVDGQRKLFKTDIKDVRNTLSDHCYHLNQPTGKELEYLGLQTPSDTSDEEIDVVTFEKPCRPTFASLPTNPNILDQQYYHQTHLYRRHHYPHHHHHQPPPSPLSPPASGSIAINTTPTTTTATTTITPKIEVDEKPQVRRRGRPPMNPEARKRAQQQQEEEEEEQSLVERTSKRIRSQRNGNKYIKKRKSSGSSKVTPTISRSSSEDDDFDEDKEKRSLHNNMERQRRIGQRMLLEKLRLEVPAVKCNEKAAKVAILKEATSHVSQLRQIEGNLKPELNELMKQRRILVAKAIELGLHVKSMVLHCATDPGASLINRRNKEVNKKHVYSDKTKKYELKIKNNSNFNKRNFTDDDDHGNYRTSANRYAKKRCHE